MTSIFISYKREDEKRILPLAKALEQVGFGVWWDHALPGGESWRENIQKALDAAQCVIVAWTEHSLGPDGGFVRDEAGQAQVRGILVPVLLDRGIEPPLGFGETQAIDLSRWRGDLLDLDFQDVIAACNAKIEGREAPPARGRLGRLSRMTKRAKFVGAAGAGAAAILGFSLNFLGVQNHVCSLPIIQPGLRDSCGALGLGNQPTHEERIAFEKLPAGDCAALSAYRDTYESSPLRSRVDSRLADKHVSTQIQWIAGERRLALTALGANEAIARKRAAARAEALCKGFGATTVYRVKSARAEGAYACEDGACGINGEAVCKVEEREEITRTTCGD